VPAPELDSSQEIVGIATVNGGEAGAARYDSPSARAALSSPNAQAAKA